MVYHELSPVVTYYFNMEEGFVSHFLGDGSNDYPKLLEILYGFFQQDHKYGAHQAMDCFNIFNLTLYTCKNVYQFSNFWTIMLALD